MICAEKSSDQAGHDRPQLGLLLVSLLTLGNDELPGHFTRDAGREQKREREKRDRSKALLWHLCATQIDKLWPEKKVTVAN